MKKNIKQFEDSIYKQKSWNNGKIGVLANNIFLELTFDIFIHIKWIFKKIEYMFMIVYNIS